MSISNAKKDFPILKRRINGKKLTYLDSAATTQKPKSVIDAMSEYYSLHNSNVHRAVYALSEESSKLYEEAHKKTAQFISAKKWEEVAFTKNCTEALNVCAFGLTQNLKRGDEILLTQLEHHSNLVPWQQAAKRRGLKLSFLPILESGILDAEAMIENITRKTKIIALTHVSNTLGTINDVKSIAKIAHENDALCVVDAAQSVAHMPLDVKKIDCDFLAFSGHKMYGPMGIGVLYGKEELMQNLNPLIYGGGMIRHVAWQESSWNSLPHKFEAGTPPVAEAVGLGAAIDYLKKIGMAKIEKHEREITAYCQKKLSALSRVQVHGPTKRAPVFSFSIESVHPHDVAAILDSEGVCVRGGHHCTMPLMDALGLSGTTRASFGLYNTKEDVDTLIKGVEKVKKVFA